MNFEKVAECFYCLSCSAKALSFIVSPSQKKDTGIFLCAECGEFYSLKDGILDARPQDLQDPAKKNLIQKEYQDYLLKNSQKPKKETPFLRDASEEFTFEEAEPAFYDQQLLASPFWQKVERKTLHTWPDFVKKHVSAGYVLDAGCGTGRVSNYLAEKGIEMIAFDVTLPMLQIARRKAQEKGVEDKILYVLADIYHMPFLKGSLTGLSFFGVFHHLKSPNRAFERCLDCLAPQAIVCGMDNHRFNFSRYF
jgi:SAM-dependent methyltransferase